MKSLFRRAGVQAVSTVNFESLNRVPPVRGLREVHGELVPGMVNTWYEYVPEKADSGKPMPLVIQLHGGGNDGRRWAEYTVWHEMADRIGLIVVYPNSPDYECWTCQKRDIDYLRALIRYECGCHCIDESRIFMQGMSNGDQMTLAFSMACPELLAAAGFATGPSDEEVLDGDMPRGTLPILQMRGEMDINWKLTPETEDIYEMRYHMNDLNREIWTEVNGTDGMVPELSIQGKDNFLLWRGRNAPIINWEIAGMGHREPVYGAQVLWDRLYSGCRRENGQTILETPAVPLQGEDDTTLLAMGSRKVFRKDRILDMPAQGTVRVFEPADLPHFCPVKTGEMCETEVMCAPAEFFAVAYGADIAYDADAGTCMITFPDGRRIVLRSGAMLFEDGGVFRALQKPCMHLCGTFYVPVGELCQMLFDAHVSTADDVMCISRHYSVLGRYTARIVRGLLSGQMRPRRRKRPE